MAAEQMSVVSLASGGEAGWASGMLMGALLLVGWGSFGYSAWRRYRLMQAAKRPEDRMNEWGRRLGNVVSYVLGHRRMLRYPLAGAAHFVIFVGFVVLLINTLILWGRGFDGGFDLLLFAPGTVVGDVYALLRDVFTGLVLAGGLVFVYFRAVRKLPRLTLNREGMVILGIIIVMMISDFLYEAGHIRAGGGGFRGTMPLASITAMVMSRLPEGVATFVGGAGFWAHSILVLVFLNLLPYGKHFHVVTVVFNVLFANPQPRGRLSPIVDMEGRIERGETLGVKRASDLSWKDVLDLYTCTECGRCSDHCPATRTGKLLSPKHLTIALRDHMYRNEGALTAGMGREGAEEGSDTAAGFVRRDGGADETGGLLVGPWVEAEALWACTTCGACEQECPVFVSYIEKIVDMRRHLVMEKGEFPEQWQNAFQGMERSANVYSFDNGQRAEWAAGLEIPLRAEKPEAEVLYWVGCSPSFDDRARKIARATATLMKEAGVNFAILGPEEQCTGDPARRAGNEFLYQTLAQGNVETLKHHGVKKIVTTCPHCFNTLKNEYPDFGGRYEVIHHTEFLAGLVREGKLRPRKAVEGTVVYHDACYLGRHNDVYDAPREILAGIPGLRMAEAVACRDRGMCCGAGGAQMWKEEEHVYADRGGPAAGKVNHERTRQLLKVLPPSGPRTIASACPFCMTMLTDGLRDQGHEDVEQLDVAELLLKSVGTGAAVGGSK